jgi:hypothetical protein
MDPWDDNIFPLAYLITFRTYGSWLYGDARGSVDRYNNKFQAPRIDDNIILEQQKAKKLKCDPVILDGRARSIVRKAIVDVCAYRGWHPHSLNVRMNHAHAVIGAGEIRPEIPLRDLKAYATRALRAEGWWKYQHSPWSDGGSTRYLWKEESVWRANDYVPNGQGDDLPDF